MLERPGVGELHIGGWTVGLRGGEDDCMEQLRKSLLEEGREGLVKRGGGSEERRRERRDGGKEMGEEGRKCIMYMYSNNNPLGAMAC